MAINTNFSNVSPDIFMNITFSSQRLNLVDILKTTLVCKNWERIINTGTAVRSLIFHLNDIPLLKRFYINAMEGVSLKNCYLAINSICDSIESLKKGQEEIELGQVSYPMLFSPEVSLLLQNSAADADASLIIIFEKLAESNEKIKAWFKSSEIDSLNPEQKANAIREWMDKSTETLNEVKFLILTNLGLTVLPPEIGKFKKLKHLYLDSNQLTELPWTIGNLTRLERLCVRQNRLTDLPWTFYQLASLKVVHLDENRLRGFSKQINQLTHLEILKVSGNLLTTLPIEISSLSNLVLIDADENQITSLPENIGELSKLEHFALHNNQLAELPLSIAHLKNLKVLSISTNQLSPYFERYFEAFFHNKTHPGHAGLRIFYLTLLLNQLKETISNPKQVHNKPKVIQEILSIDTEWNDSVNKMLQHPQGNKHKKDLLKLIDSLLSDIHKLANVKIIKDEDCVIL